MHVRACTHIKNIRAIVCNHVTTTLNLAQRAKHKGDNEHKGNDQDQFSGENDQKNIQS